MSGKNPSETYIVITEESGDKINIRFQDLVEWVNEGIYCVNKNGTIVYANERFCKNLGYSIEEITGKDVFSLMYNEEDAQLARAKLELRKQGVADSYDIQLRKKSGEAVWVKMSGRPVTNNKGEFAGSVAISTNINTHRQLEEELTTIKQEFETKVLARTKQLSEANAMLSDEVKDRMQAVNAARKSEKRFRDIFLNSPDAIYVETLDGVIQDVNEAACRMHETTREELIGKSVYDICPKHTHKDIAIRQPNIVNGSINKFETECMTKGGKVFPIEVSVAHIDYQDQPALLMHVRDISDRKQHQELLIQLNAELEQKVNERTKVSEEINNRLISEIEEKEKIQNELERQKNFLRLIIDSTPNLIFVKDKDGKYLLANESMARFYNMSTTEMEGHFDAEPNFTKDELKEFNQQDKDAIASGKEQNFPERKFRKPATGEEVWLQMVKKAIPSITGNEINILGVGTDITSIRDTKEELRKSEQLYREIARNLPKAAMFIFDKNLKYILAEGPLVGVVSKPKAEIEGKTVYDSIRESERERVKEIYQRILDGESSEAEQTFLDRTLQVYHLPIRDDNGKIIYGMVMVFDISDLKGALRELEKRATELQRSNEELERFAYVASHDLQGPLRTIASYLQLLEMRYKNKLDAEALEFIDFSVNGAKRMQKIILDLLNYSRITSVRKPMAPTDFDEEVKSVVRNLNSTIQSTNAKVQVGELPILVAEQSQIYQLFLNLIDNALKFVDNKNPLVKIDAVEHPREWKFTISDNGIGIKEEFREKIFEIFQRLHTQSEYPGTGVGLAVCQKIVQLHGGRIWFTSVYGEGTTFHFTISKNLS